MVRHSRLQSYFLPCLLAATTVAASADETNSSSRQLTTMGVGVQNRHPWCNPFSSLETRSYHFDVELDESHCETGNCIAIELVRSTEKPILDMHGSKQWLVRPHASGKKDEFDWSLFAPAKASIDDRVIDLRQVDEIRLYDSYYNKDKDETLPDKLEIVFPRTPGSTGVSTREVLDLDGGLYYNEEIMEAGFKQLGEAKMDNGDYKDIQMEAAKPGWVATGQSKGKWVGGFGAALSVGGMYTAATVTAVAVQTQALVGAALLGVIGGTAAGFALGGIVGGAIALTSIMIGTHRQRDVEITSASRKIYEKLRCMSDHFTECDTNLLVPKTKECPRTLV